MMNNFSILKKAILFFFILKSSLIFSQNFNDKIVTLTGDTIRCQILKIDSSNILYNLKVKKSFQNVYISKSLVKDWMIYKNNLHSTSWNHQGDSLFNVVNERSNDITKSLIAERIITKNGQQLTQQVIFTLGTMVYIRKYNSNTLVNGVIEYVSDSSITINEKSINLDIKIISKNRGGDVLIIGLSLIALSPIAFMVGRSIYPIKLDQYGDDINGDNILSFDMKIILFDFIDLITVVPQGIVKLATTKHYNTDNGWRLYTKN